MGLLDAGNNTSIFRKDHAMIIAQNRHLASILPIRMTYSATDLIAGTVMSRYTSGANSGLYAPYVNSGASGIGTAACILMEDHPTSEFANNTDTTLGRGIFGGEVFKDKLTGLDATAITNLGAKTIVDATAVNVLKF